jgi:hypothetical protein
VDGVGADRCSAVKKDLFRNSIFTRISCFMGTARTMAADGRAAIRFWSSSHPLVWSISRRTPRKICPPAFPEIEHAFSLWCRHFFGGPAALEGAGQSAAWTPPEDTVMALYACSSGFKFLILNLFMAPAPSFSWDWALSLYAYCKPADRMGRNVRAPGQAGAIQPVKVRPR